MVRARGWRARSVGAGGEGAPGRPRFGSHRRTDARRRGLTIRTVTRLLFAAYFFEAGLILTLAPWTVFWDRNGFTDGRPRIEAVVQSPYVRGAATGVGVITVLAGLGELASLFAGRWRSDDAPDAVDDTTRA